jgi:hypothetical protein
MEVTEEFERTCEELGVVVASCGWAVSVIVAVPMLVEEMSESS